MHTRTLSKTCARFSLVLLVIVRRSIIDCVQARFEKEAERLAGPTISVLNGWRDVMRLMTVEQHREQLELASQLFQRDLERRNAAIEAMLKELDESEEQERYAVRVHAEKLDRLLTLQERRVEDLRASFTAELRALKEEHEVERSEALAAGKTLRTEILHFMRAIKEDEEVKLGALEAEAAQNKEQQRRRALERIHALQTDMDSAIEVLERAFEEAHSRYLSNTDQRTQDFKTLSARGQHDTQMKERQRRAIKRLQLRLQYHQNKLAYLVREADEKNTALAAERDTIGRQLLALKARWAHAQEMSANRLKAMAVATKAAKDKLGEQLALAGRVLLAAETIRQLEPAEALVAPFPPLAADAIGGLTAAAGAAGFSVDAGAGAGGAGAASARLRDITLLESPSAAGAGAGGFGFGGAHEAGKGAAAAAAAMGSTAASAFGLGAAAGGAGSMIFDAQGSVLAPVGVGAVPSTASMASISGGGSGSVVSLAGLDKSLMERMSDEPDVLARFYDRFNGAVLEKLALERRVAALREENAALQGTLAKCVSSVTVSPTIVDAPNTLLVVNGRTGLLPPAGPMRGPAAKLPVATVTIEAAHVAAAATRGR